MTNTLVAVLSNNRVGLFRVLDVDNGILWFRGIVSEFQGWVRSSATLYYDPQIIGSHPKSIHVYTSEVLRYRTDGTLIPNHVRTLTQTRIPYLACFYDILEPYPVFFIDDDSSLPWTSTLTAVVNFNRVIDDYQPVAPLNSIPRVLSATAICPITLDSLTRDDAIWTPCGHVFSRMALETALARDNRCPLCRAEVSIDQCVF